MTELTICFLGFKAVMWSRLDDVLLINKDVHCGRRSSHNVLAGFSIEMAVVYETVLMSASVYKGVGTLGLLIKPVVTVELWGAVPRGCKIQHIWQEITTQQSSISSVFFQTKGPLILFCKSRWAVCLDIQFMTFFILSLTNWNTPLNNHTSVS